MHLFLTDRTLCPRCGPGFGLILLAHDVRDRRVIEGELGCPNCRERYPVRAGFADLRPPPRTPLGSSPPDPSPGPIEPEETMRLGAFLGVTEGPGTILMRGPASRYAQGLSDLIGGVEVVSLGLDLLSVKESEGVSRMLAGPQIPFLSGTFKGVLLSGEVGDRDLDESARVVGPHGRVVVLEASPGTAQHLQALGLKILLEEAGALVGQSEVSGPLPLVTLRGL